MSRLQQQLREIEEIDFDIDFEDIEFGNKYLEHLSNECDLETCHFCQEERDY